MSTSSLTWWVLRIFIVILIIDQVRNYVALSDVDQKTVSDDNWALELGKCSIALTQVLDLILSIKWIALDEKLTALVVVSTTHHWIHWRLILRSVRVVRVVHWDDEVIHLLFENLLTCCILDVATGGTSSIVWLFVVVAFRSVLYTEVGESVEFLPSWAIFISYEWLTVKIVVLLLWENTHWVQKKGEIFLEVGWAQDFQLEGWNNSLLN